MLGIFAAHSTPPSVLEWALTTALACTYAPTADSFRQKRVALMIDRHSLSSSRTGDPARWRARRPPYRYGLFKAQPVEEHGDIGANFGFYV